MYITRATATVESACPSLVVTDHSVTASSIDYNMSCTVDIWRLFEGETA